MISKTNFTWVIIITVIGAAFYFMYTNKKETKIKLKAEHL